MLTSKETYEEIGRNFRGFLDWRYKILAGYITAMAALSIGFANAENERYKAAIIAAGLLMSLVYWILDFRNGELYATCQDAGAKIETESLNPGCYTELSALKDRNGYYFTHRLAINVLVAVAIGGLTSIAVWRMQDWFSIDVGALIAVVIVAVFTIGPYLLFTHLGKEARAMAHASFAPQEERPGKIESSTAAGPGREEGKGSR